VHGYLVYVKLNNVEIILIKLQEVIVKVGCLNVQLELIINVLIKVVVLILDKSKKNVHQMLMANLVLGMPLIVRIKHVIILQDLIII